jgi:hypothetical protein
MKKQICFYLLLFSLLFDSTMSYAQFSQPRPSSAKAGGPVVRAPVVTLFEHCDYGGRKFDAYVGVYPQMPGNFNDILSSIKVKSGYTVALFEHENFGGSQVKSSISDDCFAERRPPAAPPGQITFDVSIHTNNDMTSSMMIFPVNEVVFSGADTKVYYEVKPGTYNTMPFTLSPISISTVMVTTNPYQITLYREANLKGESYSFYAYGDFPPQQLSDDAKLWDFLSRGGVNSMTVFTPPPHPGDNK